MQAKSRSAYRNILKEIESTASCFTRSTYALNCLTTTLSTLVIAWEDYFVNAHDYDIHPYDKAEQLFGDVLSYLNIMIAQDRYLSDDDLKLSSDFISKNMEDSHQDLFQELWTRFNEDDYRKRISDYTYRIKLNNLEPFIEGANCIDFGCGHGNFGQALIECGARSVLGLDFGDASIAFAKKASEMLGVKAAQYKVASVYNSGEDSDSFDFAIQNGVFHHLQNEDKAYVEVNRVLKVGGYFWIYTDGKDNIQGEQDTYQE